VLGNSDADIYVAPTKFQSTILKLVFICFCVNPANS